MGLAGDYGGTFLWTRIAGTAVARRLYLLNEKLSASQAFGLGMVEHVVPAPDLRAFTLELARRLAKSPAEVLALVKDNLNQAEDDVHRRRYLFASESFNQQKAGERILRRMRPLLRRPSTPEGKVEPPWSTGRSSSR